MKDLAPLVAIVCLTILEGLALWRGVDGLLFGFVITCVAGLGGYTLSSVVAGRTKGPRTRG